MWWDALGGNLYCSSLKSISKHSGTMSRRIEKRLSASRRGRIVKIRTSPTDASFTQNLMLQCLASDPIRQSARSLFQPPGTPLFHQDAQRRVEFDVLRRLFDTIGCLGRQYHPQSRAVPWLIAPRPWCWSQTARRATIAGRIGLADPY